MQTLLKSTATDTIGGAAPASRSCAAPRFDYLAIGYYPDGTPFILDLRAASRDAATVRS